jgi:membrane fusion protein (multidrug efflux system)
MSRKLLARIGIGLLVLLMIGAGAAYWRHIKIFVSTDDAYVTGYVGVISARVPGRVAKILVDNNQHVTPGQVLVTLEPQDYEVAVAREEGNLGRLRQELAQAYVRVSTAKTRVPQAEANFKMAGLDKSRYTSLFERRTIPKQTLDQVETGSTDIPIDEQPAIKEAKARLEQARLNLGYTKITAQIEGYITRRQVEVGNWVQPGQALMMLVPLGTSQLWVQANYKETELNHLYIGQPARVRVDTYPGVEFTGRVDSIMAGTGSAFSLLPPENATGNWVKVVQRVPVKITLSPPFPANRPLRLGMSTEVTVDTRERTGKRLSGPEGQLSHK